MALMGEAVRRAGGSGWRAARGLANQAAYFTHRPFGHPHLAGARGHRLGQQPVSPPPGVADALRNSRQPDLQRRAGRVGQDQRRLKVLRPQTAGHRPRALTSGERDNRVEARMVLPEFSELLVREQGDVRIRQRFTEPLQGRGGHDGVAQPIDAAHQNAAGTGGGGGKRSRHRPGEPYFHRLCTQNQLAGSRRTAASNARFTSRMMSAVGRGWPFSWVGISGPASMRQRARPTR